MLQAAPTKPRSSARTALDQLLRPARVRTIVVLLVIELVLFFSALLIPIDATQQQALVSRYNSIVQSATGGSAFQTFTVIFLNNVRVALLEMVPVFGVSLWGFSLYTTGQVLQAFAISANIPPVAAGIVTFIFPHAIVEFAGYSLAVAEGVMLIWAVFRRRLRAEVTLAAYNIVLVGAALGLAAVIETVEIVSPGVGLVMWGPVILITLAVVLKAKRGPAR